MDWYLLRYDYSEDFVSADDEQIPLAIREESPRIGDWDSTDDSREGGVNEQSIR